ncbi:alcohol dehydrogenase [Burkholderia sp. WAC0059]|uniref:zinc-dependent alcohol dehydrogenase family protein n=1 Tax=Burkholderia sp. WAC0059 TaxID=2066022 RepID=UPI000C7EA681|nr:NAD(P)-dependent alcohol dehydrogenase [Burkholderia sp. WAC0059]PLZ03893.1 alcohol dehydrogenase [Burkholderia sp. WAC0059]
MKVYRFDQTGSIDHLTPHDEPVPTPQRGEVLVRIRASSLNYRDLAMVHGNYVGVQQPGLIPLSDAAGEVAEVGEGVDLFKVGDRVINTFHPRWLGGPPPATLGSQSYGSHLDGWLAEYKVVSQEALVAAPANLSFEEAATLPCAALTAWTALGGFYPVRPGHTVLTLGTGGVSVFAVQLAKALGARVISTTSSAEKAERLKALGADAVVNYVEVPNWGDAVRELNGGRGVERIVEVGGAGTLAQSVRAIANRGEVVMIGFLDGADAGVGYNAFFRSGGIFYRISVGDRAGLRELVRVVDTTGLKPVVDQVFPFDRALDAWRHFENRAFLGKVVISH